jgi:DNA repair photolyase
MIYETNGRAREYFELAANLYSGCEHACRYCYGADVMHKKPDEFFRRGTPRPDALELLRGDAARLAKKGERRHVLLSFVTDPYQPAEAIHELTRAAIAVLHNYGIYAAILTKGGHRATRDFDRLSHLDLFGVSLTCRDPLTIARWEPNVPLVYERVESLKLAKAAGIPTWVSCEPVLVPGETLELIREAAPYTDHFKVGTLNYCDEAKATDWKRFAKDAVELLESLGKPYYIKKDLARYLGQPEGITKGNVPK